MENSTDDSDKGSIGDGLNTSIFIPEPASKESTEESPGEIIDGYLS